MMKDLLRLGAITLGTSAIITLFVFGVGGLAGWIRTIQDKADANTTGLAATNATIQGTVSTINAQLQAIQASQKTDHELLQAILDRQLRLSQAK